MREPLEMIHLKCDGTSQKWQKSAQKPLLTLGPLVSTRAGKATIGSMRLG